MAEHLIDVARFGRTRKRLIAEPSVVAMYTLQEKVSTTARCRAFDRNHGTWEGTGTQRGVSIEVIPEGEMGAIFDGNGSVVTPNDGEGFRLQDDSGPRTMSLAFGPFDIVALIAPTVMDGTLRPIAQKQVGNSGGDGWHFAVQSGNLIGVMRAGGSGLLSIARTWPFPLDGIPRWAHFHCRPQDNVAKLFAAGHQLGADESMSGELERTTGDFRIARFNDLTAGAGFQGLISMVMLGREGNPNLCAALQSCQTWSPIVQDIRTEEDPVTTSRGFGEKWAPVAEPGTCAFALDNSPLNDAEKAGFYAPGHANAWPGWIEGIPIRWRAIGDDGVDRVVFRGFIESILPEAGSARSQRVHVTCETWLRQAMRERVRYLPVYQDLRSDEAVWAVLDRLDRPPVNTDFAPGDSTFPVLFEEVKPDTPAYAELSHICQQEGGRLYERADGTLVFENQSARYLDVTPAAQWTEYDLDDLAPARDLETIVNVGRAKLLQRVVDTDRTVVADMVTRLALVPGSDPLELELPYTQEGQRDVEIGAVDVLLPVAGTDFTVFSNPDGTGADLTADAAVVSVGGGAIDGAAAKLRISWSSVYNTGYFRTQVRGKRVVHQGEVVLEHRDVESVKEYDEKNPLAITFDYQSDPELALSILRQRIALQALPATEAETVSRRGPDFEADMLDRDVGDMVLVSEPMTGMDDEARNFIHRVELTMEASGVFAATYGLTRFHASRAFGIVGDDVYGLVDSAVVA